MTITIYAVGDIMLGEQPLCYNFGVKSIIKNKGVDYLFRDVRSIFKDGNIVFGNLEAPISNESDKEGVEAYLFRAEHDVIGGLKKANFNVLSVANNHIMEHGERAFWSTINSLKENDITSVGISNRTEILETNGFKIGILAYSFIDDFIDNRLYNIVSSEGEIINNIKNIRDFVDLIILSLHWGYEYVPFPSPEQVEIGRNFIDAGADVLLGHHAHVIQGYEIYKRKLIIYGLGNFIFDHTYIKSTQKSIIAKIIVDPDVRNIYIDHIPIVCDFKEYYPKIADKKNGDSIQTHISSIREKIENKSLSDYGITTKSYLTLAYKYKKEAKRGIRVQFIKNIYKYPLNLSISIVKSYLQKLLK